MLAGRTEAGAGGKPVELRLTLVTGQRTRTLILPPAAMAVFLGILPLAGLLFLGATGYFMFHDDLLADLMQRQIAMQYSYEDRLAQQRHEITNLTQLAKIDEAGLAGSLGTLAQRQRELENRTALVANLAERAAALHGTANAEAAGVTRVAATPATGEKTDPLLTRAFALPATASAYAPVEKGAASPSEPAELKPQPEGFELRLNDQSATHLKTEGQGTGAQSRPVTPLSFDFDLPLTKRLDRLAAREDRLDHAQLALLSGLQKPAKRIAMQFQAAFDAAGLAADQLTLPTRKPEKAAGGPFVPLPTTSADGTAFARAAAEAQSVIASAERLRLLASHVPFGSPLAGRAEVTSPFGPRIDPFLGRPALHTGVDLSQDYGAPVRATAEGTVTFAGSDGGYGNMVEINHGNGLSTRYAHLSSLSVRQGQKVDTDTIIGHIGETGRATGPHLHYETRIDGEPVNPERFLKAGLTLHMARADIEL